MFRVADAKRIVAMQDADIARLEFPEMALAVRETYRLRFRLQEDFYAELVIQVGVAIHQIAKRLGLSTTEEHKLILTVTGAMVNELAQMGIRLRANEIGRGLYGVVCDLIDLTEKRPIDPGITARMN
jgi:hypothetical protein